MPRRSFAWVRLASRFAVVLAFALVALAGPASAEKRVALVIGNGDYRNAARLANPVNDARAVAASLERLGFEVHALFDVTQAQALEGLGRFAGALPGAEAAIFYYSGHGIQIGEENYLLPIDVRAEDEFSLRYGAVEVSDVVRSMERTAPVSIVVLDACRDNPFAEQLQRSLGRTRAVAVSRGLGRIAPSSNGTIIAYAAAAGAVAADGTADHSPYTAALLKEMEAPGVEVGLLLRRVAGHVIEATGGEQQPELLIRLAREYYLRPATGQPETAGVAGAAAAPATVTPTPTGDAKAASDAGAPSIVVGGTAASSTAGRTEEASQQMAAASDENAPTEDVMRQASPPEIQPSRWGYYAGLIEPQVEALATHTDWTPPSPGNAAEAEPNNSFGTANEVNPNDRLAFAIAERGDQDWFRFTIARPGELVILAPAPPPEIDLAVRLLDGDGATVLNWTQAPRPGGALEARIAIKQPGTYRLNFSDGSADAASAAPIAVSLQFTPETDPFEPNDSVADARPLALDGNWRLNISPIGDHDWFQLAAHAPGALEISATEVPEAIGISFRVLDADLNTVLNWTAAPRPGGDTLGNVDLPRPGAYFIEAAANGDSGASIRPFRLATRFTPNADPFEPNGRVSQSWRIEPEGERAPTIFPRGDHDFFAFNAASQGELSLAVTGAPQTLDVAFRVLDADLGTVLNWTNAPRPGGDNLAITDLSRPGRYFIELADGGDDAASIEPFAFRLALAPNPDQYEPNDTMGAATKLTPGGEIAFTILPRGDGDWFRLWVNEPGELKVAIDEGPPGLAFAFRVLDANRNTVTNWVNAYAPGGLTEGIADLPRAGAYYLEVRDAGDDGRSIRHATLTTRFTPTHASGEPNDRPKEAVEVSLPGENAAHVLPLGDGDWHVFYAEKPGTLKVTIDGMPEALDVAFRVLDADFNTILNWAAPPAKGGVNSAEAAIAAPGWYWMEIRDSGNDARSPQAFRVRREFTPQP